MPQKSFPAIFQTIKNTVHLPAVVPMNSLTPMDSSLHNPPTFSPIVAHSSTFSTVMSGSVFFRRSESWLICSADNPSVSTDTGNENPQLANNSIVIMTKCVLHFVTPLLVVLSCPKTINDRFFHPSRFIWF